MAKKIEGGNGGKKGHSNMNHWDYTAQIKRSSKKARRQQGKLLAKEEG